MKATKAEWCWLAALGAVAFVVGFQGFWLERSLEDELSYRGYFEPSSGRVRLVFRREQPTAGLSFPLPGLLEDGRYVVPTGTVVAMPVHEGVEYRVTGALSGLTPYVVVGELAVGQDSCGSSEEYCTPGGLVLQSPKHLVPSADDGALVEWPADRPWRSDEDWLRGLAAACVAADQAEVALSREGDHVSVRVGRCQARYDGVDEHTVFAVLGGPSVSLIRTTPPVLRFHSRPAADRLLATAVVGALIALTARGVFGAIGAISLLLAALGLSLWSPVVGRATTLLLSVGIVGTRTVMLLPGLGDRLGPVARGGVLVIVLLVLGVGSALPQRYRSAPTPRGFPRLEPACFVTGYSTAHGEGMREEHGGRFDPAGGVNDRLNRSCAPCTERTVTTAEGGETFAFVRDAVCAPSSLRSDGVVIFLGGANDDLLGWRDALLPPLQAAQRLLLAVLSFSHRDFDAAGLEAVQEQAINASLASLPTHLDEIREAVRCARSRGHRFIFVNDFVAMDLPRGRSAARARIMEERRRVVEESGGTFVDLLEVLGRDVGVSWFNDFVHPAMDVHRRISEIVCDLVSSGASHRES